MKTFAWQVENGKSARNIEMQHLPQDTENKTIKTENRAGKSSNTAPSTAMNLSCDRMQDIALFTNITDVDLNSNTPSAISKFDF